MGRKLPGGRTARSQSSKSRRGGLKIASIVERLEERALFSAVTVTNLHDSGAGSLRAAINAAADGDTIGFAKGLHGTITLTSGELDIDKTLAINGPGITISGNHVTRILAMFPAQDGTPPALSLTGLTLTGGHAGADASQIGVAAGGAILELGGSLNLTNVVVSDNLAIAGPGLPASGGGVFIGPGGFLDSTNSSYTSNSAIAGSNGQSSIGGAIGVQAADQGFTEVDVNGGDFSGNRAVGGDGGNGNSAPNQQLGTGAGGAIGASGGIVSIAGAGFISNFAIGGNNGSGGTGSLYTLGLGVGGAIAVEQGTSLGIDGSLVASNHAVGGNNAKANASAGLAQVGDALGGGIFAGFGSVAMITNTRVAYNLALGGNNDGGAATAKGGLSTGTAAGGGINVTGSSSLNIAHSRVYANTARGGVGGVSSFSGGTAILDANQGFGGGVAINLMTRMSGKVVSIDHNSSIAGTGETNARAGGALYGGLVAGDQSDVALFNCNINYNEAIGGAGTLGLSGGDASDALGGGVGAFASSGILLDHTSLDHNLAVGGVAAGAKGFAGYGLGGGGEVDGTSFLVFKFSPVTSNIAKGGKASPGGKAGYGFGGGIEVGSHGEVELFSSSVYNNAAIAGSPNGRSFGGGIDNSDNVPGLVYIDGSSTVSSNAAILFPDLYGNIIFGTPPDLLSD